MYVDMDIVNPYFFKNRLSSFSRNIFHLSGITYTTSIITYIQLISDMRSEKESLKKLNELKKIKLDFIPLDKEIMRKAIEIVKKHEFTTHTAIHAATSMNIGEKILSFNRKLEGIPGIKRVDPYIFLSDNIRPGFDEKFKSMKF